MTRSHEHSGSSTELDPLPESLAENLHIVFCGTAAGPASARMRGYYAGPGNAFWPTLHAVALTPTRIAPSEFRDAIAFGIGLTDLVRGRVGLDKVLRARDFDRENLKRTIELFFPRALAFNGKRAGEEFLQRKVDYGWQSERIGNTRIYVLPSSSAAAQACWDDSHWKALARFVRERAN